MHVGKRETYGFNQRMEPVDAAFLDIVQVDRAVLLELVDDAERDQSRQSLSVIVSDRIEQYTRPIRPTLQAGTRGS